MVHATLIIVLLVSVVLVQTTAIIIGDRHNRLGLKVITSANAIARDSTDSQLRQIHALVNSDMTTARQGELSQALISVTVMNKLMALELAAGKDITDDLALIATTEKRIQELRKILSQRSVQQANADHQGVRGDADALIALIEERLDQLRGRDVHEPGTDSPS